MSGLNTSEKDERKKLEEIKWKGVDIESLLEEGDVEVVRVNRDGNHGQSRSYDVSLLVERDDLEYELGGTVSGRYLSLNATYASNAELVKFFGEFEDKYQVEEMFENNYNAEIARKNR